jgi:hypothetical protein
MIKLKMNDFVYNVHQKNRNEIADATFISSRNSESSNISNKFACRSSSKIEGN